MVKLGAKDPNSIGNLALARGLISQPELEAALEAQRERVRLGQILVDLDLISVEQRDDLLLEQRARRGERISIDELHRHERGKLRRRLKGITAGFRDASSEAEAFAASIGALTGQILDGSK